MEQGRLLRLKLWACRHHLKPDRLMKRSVSITTAAGQRRLHLVSYYLPWRPAATTLQRPSTDPALRHMRPEDGLYPELTVNGEQNPGFFNQRLHGERRLLLIYFDVGTCAHWSHTSSIVYFAHCMRLDTLESSARKKAAETSSPLARRVSESPRLRP
ncbi:Gluconate transport-inducing protein [Aspergillus fumigatus]